AALRRWAADAGLRAGLRAAARRRADRLPRWTDTVATVGRVLAEVAA
ncbi:glycosyltransferase family 1 protein, partial [Kineococcus sp. R8]|nr:glycosyltransferase family 1 protein [Kineococcus siccus]